MHHQCSFCQGPSFYLNFLVNKGHNSKKYNFQSYAPCALQMHLIMICKYPTFGADTLNTFWVMGNIKVFNHNDNDLAIIIAQSFLQNRKATCNTKGL